MENFLEVLNETFKNKDILLVLLSILPLIESKGAIPFAINLGMDYYKVIIYPTIVSIFLCPVIIIMFTCLFKLMKKNATLNRLFGGIENFFRGKAEGLKNKKYGTKDAILLLYLFLFVAFPLPLTGVWTSSVIACILPIDKKLSAIAIILGNFVASMIMFLMTVLLKENSIYILYAIMVCVILGFTFALYKMLRRKT